VSRTYLDTSAALKLLVEEPESAALASHLDETPGDVVACWLLETELRRAVARLGGVSQQSVSALLDTVEMYAVPPSLFREAGLLPGATVRSLDAIHLAAALRLDVETLVTYDRRMADSAHALGLRTQAPR
jgi:predicted nucleic acid-binding protein